MTDLHGPTKRQSSYWYPGTVHGSSPYAPSGDNYSAKGGGVSDDTAAINSAITNGGRCGPTCGATSYLQAVVYFPPGVYLISKPSLQYYFTSFTSDPNNHATIKGTLVFNVIALVDTDMYIPGGNGSDCNEAREFTGRALIQTRVAVMAQ